MMPFCQGLGSKINVSFQALPRVHNTPAQSWCRPHEPHPQTPSLRELPPRWVGQRFTLEIVNLNLNQMTQTSPQQVAFSGWTLCALQTCLESVHAGESAWCHAAKDHATHPTVLQASEQTTWTKKVEGLQGIWDDLWPPGMIPYVI